MRMPPAEPSCLEARQVVMFSASGSAASRLEVRLTTKCLRIHMGSESLWGTSCVLEEADGEELSLVRSD